MLKYQTSLTRLLNIDIPIILAPMSNAVSPELAAAVPNAGGLGMLSATWRDLESTRQVIRKTRSLTSRPFGVNLVLAWPQEERLAICLEEGVPIISFFYGDSSKYIERVHAAGALVMHTIGSAAQARLASVQSDSWSPCIYMLDRASVWRLVSNQPQKLCKQWQKRPHEY